MAVPRLTAGTLAINLSISIFFSLTLTTLRGPSQPSWEAKLSYAPSALQAHIRQRNFGDGLTEREETGKEESEVKARNGLE